MKVHERMILYWFSDCHCYTHSRRLELEYDGTQSTILPQGPFFSAIMTYLRSVPLNGALVERLGSIEDTVTGPQ